MNLVFFTHPSFFGSNSMPRFTQMLALGMKERGHHVELWSPHPLFVRVPFPSGMKKWLGYIDQFIVFPEEVRKRLKKCARDTLYIFTDQALGLWVPLVSDRPHVIHCHDFLAQQSALGQFEENPTGWTGRQYQSLIRRGYSKGKHFISVSNKTREDLHHFLPVFPTCSEVVYNGLNQKIEPQSPELARSILGDEISINLSDGYLLHVGGNQWYKNRTGVIEIYNAWRMWSGKALPLLMIGMQPSDNIQKERTQSPFREDIHFLTGVPDRSVLLAYSGASVFLFPSLAEGFGWPIAEAMAAGCPVITTDEAPMNDVAGKAGFLIPRRPLKDYKIEAWAISAARVVDKIIELKPEVRKTVVAAGLLNAKRFDTEFALNRIEMIYKGIIEKATVL
ncbi:mannosyltransferase [Flammeovirgaceae bacterium 311]|nr:mannosyltransferase [Flammeovirgaceae bacterium 311]